MEVSASHMTEIAEVFKARGNVGALLGRSFHFELATDRPNRLNEVEAVQGYFKGCEYNMTELLQLTCYLAPLFCLWWNYYFYVYFDVLEREEDGTRNSQ